jgi:hypothetical protein
MQMSDVSQVWSWIGTATPRPSQSLAALAVLGCAHAPSPRQPEAPPGECGNAVLHEEFEKDLAAAQAEADPERRAVAVCKVAHDWGIEDCSNVTPDSLNLP